jgi:hypothetical protein
VVRIEGYARLPFCGATEAIDGMANALKERKLLEMPMRAQTPFTPFQSTSSKAATGRRGVFNHTETKTKIRNENENITL